MKKALRNYTPTPPESRLCYWISNIFARILLSWTFIHTRRFLSATLTFLSRFSSLGRIQWPDELDLDLSAELMNSNQYSKWVDLFANFIKALPRRRLFVVTIYTGGLSGDLKSFNWRHFFVAKKSWRFFLIIWIKLSFCLLGSDAQQFGSDDAMVNFLQEIKCWKEKVFHSDGLMKLKIRSSF